MATHFFAPYREQWFLGCSLACLIINPPPLLVVVQLLNFTRRNYWRAPIIIPLGSQFSFPFIAEHVTMVQSHHPPSLFTYCFIIPLYPGSFGMLFRTPFDGVNTKTFLMIHDCKICSQNPMQFTMTVVIKHNILRFAN